MHILENGLAQLPLGGRQRRSDNAGMAGMRGGVSSEFGGRAETSGARSKFTPDAMRAEKRSVAAQSVFAALAITALKIIVGVTTGSLGILSEAAHSALDLIAAILTLFSVRVSDKPADADHQYGHGKVENFSAFIETGLLLLTCLVIVY